MKKTFTLLLFSAFFALFATANTIIIKGYVKNTDNKVVSGKLVKITTDSVGNVIPCSIYHSKYTGTDGIFTDTITCNGDIKKVKITVENCDGTKIINTPEVNANNIAETSFTICVAVTTPPPTPTCSASFLWSISGKTVNFSSLSSKPSNDSISGRSWAFGDNDSLKATTYSAQHIYSKAGIYNVCLTIKTITGCESKVCNTIEIKDNVVVIPPPVTCTAYFTFEKITSKKMRFNSSSSISSTGDSIATRYWRFGDGTILTGNEISPSKEFAQNGSYTVCLNTVSAKGCKSEICKIIVIHDSLPPSTGTAPINNAAIKIISINPNPVTTRMIVTVWSANNNTEVELGISDIYGFKRWTMKKTLIQGNNTVEISTSFLNSGPYFLKVGSKYGSLSRGFYKL